MHGSISRIHPRESTINDRKSCGITSHPLSLTWGAQGGGKEFAEAGEGRGETGFSYFLPLSRIHPRSIACILDAHTLYPTREWESTRPLRPLSIPPLCRKGRRRGEARTRAASWSVHACASAREAHTCEKRGGADGVCEHRGSADDSRKLQSSPSIREGEEGGGGWDRWCRGGEGRARGKEREERGGEGWRQGEIEELLSDQRRTEKLFPAFELLHTRAFPSDGKAASKWKSHEFLPPTATSRVCALYMVLSYARLRIRGFLRSPPPRFRSEVNFYRLYLFQWGRMIRFLV